MKIANNVSEIGNTPLVFLDRIAKGCQARVAAKLDFLTRDG